MDKDDLNRVLEGEIVDDAQGGTPAVPSSKAHAPQTKRAGMAQNAAGKSQASGWIELIVAIGGGIVKWLASSSRNTPSGGASQTGTGRGGDRIRRRRGGCR